jgi:hypothetical protein
MLSYEQYAYETEQYAYHILSYVQYAYETAQYAYEAQNQEKPRCIAIYRGEHDFAGVGQFWIKERRVLRAGDSRIIGGFTCSRVFRLLKIDFSRNSVMTTISIFVFISIMSS